MTKGYQERRLQWWRELFSRELPPPVYMVVKSDTVVCVDRSVWIRKTLVRVFPKTKAGMRAARSWIRGRLKKTKQED